MFSFLSLLLNTKFTYYNVVRHTTSAADISFRSNVKVNFILQSAIRAKRGEVKV